MAHVGQTACAAGPGHALSGHSPGVWPFGASFGKKSATARCRANSSPLCIAFRLARVPPDVEAKGGAGPHELFPVARRAGEETHLAEPTVRIAVTTLREIAKIVREEAFQKADAPGAADRRIIRKAENRQGAFVARPRVAGEAVIEARAGVGEVLAARIEAKLPGQP